ncbi:transposase [Bacteroides fragilis]|nr:transposase [Bacteroides fragilis]
MSQITLYKREDDYRRYKLTATQTKEKRNDTYTNSIVNALQSELYDLLALPEEEMSDLTRTALNYLHKFWGQLLAYRKDGEYTIDNLAAERAIRPLTVKRKTVCSSVVRKGLYDRQFIIPLLKPASRQGSALQVHDGGQERSNVL